MKWQSEKVKSSKTWDIMSTSVFDYKGFRVLILKNHNMDTIGWKLNDEMIGAKESYGDYYIINNRDEESLARKCRYDAIEFIENGNEHHDSPLAYDEAELECPLDICDGSGEVQAYDSPIEPHLPATPAGTEPCLCRKNNDHE